MNEMERNMTQLRIIGGGLSGCEAAWQAAVRGVRVVIYEMRSSDRKTQAHNSDSLAELVCSNSFRSDDKTASAIGLLHEEMRLMGSLIMKCADENKVPAGGALAVDREAFAHAVQNAITSHPNIRVVRGEVVDVPDDEMPTIIATGPLTSDALSQSILKTTGHEYMAFFDAIAPIIYKDSIDFSKAWFQSRYDKEGPGGDGKDYINCPMTREQYFTFVAALVAGEKTDFKEWEKNTPYFEGCLPIEVMAERGPETLRYGPMKPVGLTNPHSSEKQYAVVQLRQDNKLGTLYNIVGFQTKLKYAEQQSIFRTIPGLENAEFARLGGIHRNTFIKSPVLLDATLRLKLRPAIRFAGQVTGVEGYVESAASGLMAGMFAANEILENDISLPPRTTALGSLLAHVTGGAESETFQPMNINFGLMPPPNGRIPKKERKAAYCSRAIADLNAWLAQQLYIRATLVG
jgi:methylenetetrahydrofolate--tRNA-(uracil-5-)-methyltransferase